MARTRSKRNKSRFGSFFKRGRNGFEFNWPRILAVLASLGLVAVIAASIMGMVVFAYFSKDLPSPDKITSRDRSLSTKILDRNGEPLYDIYGEENRVLVQLEDLPPDLIAATLAAEDADFYKHQGFDIRGMVRAAFNIAMRQDLQGGSTITQQLVKNTLLTSERTIPRKIKELVLALQIEKKYSKDQILQMYFNEIPYGGQASGVEAAANSYFGKSAEDLTATEASYLAGLPQRPSYYIAYPEEAEARRQHIIDLMQKRGWWESQTTHKTISLEKAAGLKDNPPEVGTVKQNIKAPHFVWYVRNLLTERYGQEMVEKGGLKVTTTLDLDLHQQYQDILKEEIEKAEGLQVGNGALVAIDPNTGEINSMVGSKDYFADPEPEGCTPGVDCRFEPSVNVALSHRQPGSSIKPITYVTAFKKGYTPATMLVDAKTTFPGGVGNPNYVPRNYDGKFRGPVQLRYALANSVNIPAVKLLKLVGVRDMLQTAYDMGLTTLEPSDENASRFGLSITLGGGEVRLLDMVSSFGVFANKGVRHEPVAILKVEDSDGNVLEEFKLTDGERVLEDEEAYLISDILSDNSARSEVFGPNSPLNIPGYDVAVKTGTTDDKRDNWTVGYNPNMVIGVWVGNNDNSPMNQQLSSGITGAAPIWNRAMTTYLNGKDNTPFERPDGIVTAEVDSLSGMKPTHLSDTRSEIFIRGTVPVQEDNMHVELEICEADDKLATEECEEEGEVDDKTYIDLKAALPEWQEEVDEWVEEEHGDDEKWNPPDEESDYYYNPDGDSEEPYVRILEPEDGSEVGSVFEVVADILTPHTVLKVEFYLDDVLLASKTSIPYKKRVEIDEPGEYTITVKGYDSAGNVGTRDIKVVTENA